MIFKYEICDSCETVQHCRAFGCIPIEPQQKPVAWALYQRDLLLSFWMDKGDAYDFEFTSEHRWKPLYTQPTAQHQPVAIVAVDGIGQIQVGWLKKPQHNDKLYTQQPAQHQPLTEKEINDLCPQFEDPMRREMWITGFKVAHNIGN